ncbi:hypothetical protein [Dickeya dianthicola]|uniref:hypothetical protein n=1 Tax=Dickeya dianthicola TaxID=204039 RepID=UPI001866DEEA|nr:hypothetical protein [Dickeya dianthicola]QOL15203.1 hypothetical protein HGI48_13930 [Dickeya dianthicola]
MANSSYSFSLTLPPPPSGGPYPAGTEGPFLVPPVTVGTPVYTTPLLIYVIAVCAPNTTAATPGITSTANTVFQMSFSASSYSNTTFLAVVSVAAANVYSQDKAARAQLLTAFKQFCQQVEALEVPATSTSGGLLPGAAATLLNRVALSMPLRINEVLSYLYNFDPVNQYVDLSPGMGLRIEWAGYQYCDPPGGPGYGFNAFANTGSSLLRVAQKSDLTLTLDAFSGSFLPGYNTSPAATCPILAAGPMDLNLSGNGRRHLRIIFPTTIAGSGSLDNGGTQQQLSSWIVGADTFADLEAATQDILNGGTGCGKQSGAHQPIVSINFTSRVMLIPEISVRFNGMPLTVPLGTTIRNLIAQFADPATTQYLSSNYINSDITLALKRWLQNTGAPSTAATVKYYQANFLFLPPNTSQPSVYNGVAGDQYDTPLLKGDVISMA